MKIILFLIFFFTLNNCSFDNKSGIWSGQAQEDKIKKQSTIGKVVNAKENFFSEEIKVSSNNYIQIEKSKEVNNWTSIYLNDKNLVPNINFDLKSKSTFSTIKKITGKPVHTPLILNNVIIFSNNKGDIFIYDMSSDKEIIKINFYKKKFKKVEKKLYLKISKDNLYIADNLGYIYAYSLIEKKFIWAKNYGIPYRSEIKIANNQLIISDQDNTIFSYDVNNGNILWKFNLKNSFIKSKLDNSLVLDEEINSLFIHTTEGEIYSINFLNNRINWLYNLKRSSITSDFDVFYNYPIVVQKNYIFTGSNNRYTSIDKITGRIKWQLKLKLSSIPIISNNFSFVVTQNNFLICIDNNTGKILWSKNIDKELANKQIKTFDTKPQKIKRFVLLNDNVSLIYSSGKILNFQYRNGDFVSMLNFKKGITNPPIFSNNKFMFFSGKKMISLM